MKKFILNHKKRMVFLIISVLVLAAFLILIFGDGGLMTQIKKLQTKKIPSGPRVVVSGPVRAKVVEETFAPKELLEPKRSLSQEARVLREKILKKPAVYRGSWGDRILAETSQFTISYLASEDRFVIAIRDPKVRAEAENYFLKNVLESEDQTSICELDVMVADFSTSPSSLSLCPSKVQSSIFPNFLIQSSIFPKFFWGTAFAHHDWCSNYPAGLISNWCTKEKLQPYLGDVADAAARIAYRESGGCQPQYTTNFNTYCPGGYCVGLFQINTAPAAGHCKRLVPPLPSNSPECIEQLQKPDINATIARQIFDEAGGVFCRSESDPNPWGTGVACHLCGNVGSPNIPPPASPLFVPVVAASFPTPTPPPPSPGRIKGDIHQLTGTSKVKAWLDGGSPSTPEMGAGISSPASFDFSGLTPGVHTVHLSFDRPDITTVVVSACTSDQEDCGPSFHSLGTISGDHVKRLNGEILKEVNIPPGGFVDLRFYLGAGVTLKDTPSQFASLIPDLKTPDFLETLIQTVKASSYSAPPPVTDFVQNLPACSDSIYGGVRTAFTLFDATKAEYEVYLNGNLIYNSIRDSGAWYGLDPSLAYTLYADWFNLSPQDMFTWRVRAGNAGGWGEWTWGYHWKVSRCTVPPPPTPTCDSSFSEDKLHVCYFDGTAFNTYLTGQDESFVISQPTSATLINHNWYGNEINDTGQTDTVSGIWRGRINFSPGYYQFTIDSDDGVALDVGLNGYDIAQFADGVHDNIKSKWLYLNGYTNIILYWYENTGWAKLKLRWDKDTTLPTSSITSPPAGSWQNQSFFVGVSDSDTQSGIAYCYYSIDDLGRSGLELQKSFRACNNATAAAVTVGPTGYCRTQGGNTCKVMVWAEDKAGNIGGKTSRTFSIIFDLNADSDNDGWKNGTELYLGTDPFDKCPNNSQDDAWPPDIDNNRYVNIIDVMYFRSAMLTCQGNPNYTRRLDLDMNGCINIIDILVLRPYILTSCTD